MTIGASEFLFTDYKGANAISLFMYSHSAGTIAVLSLLFPIIVSLPYASSFVEDINTSLINYIHIRMNKFKYIISKLIVNALIGGYVLASVMLVFFIVYLFMRNFNIDRPNNFDIYVFTDIFTQSPFTYVILLIMNSFLCGMAFATIGLGISAWIKNKYVAVIAPFLFYIFSGTVLYKINPLFHAVVIYDLNYIHNITYIFSFLYASLLIVIGCSLFIFGVLRIEE